MWRCPPIVALAIVAFACALPPSVFAQDDWHVVERHMNGGTAEDANPQAKSETEMVECGENAQPASEPYKTIVAQLEDMYGVSFPVYESVRVTSPHTTKGGCIFYNRQFLASLLQQWMNIGQQETKQPMLYAIFAHELGHQVHGDFDPSNDAAALKIKELGADQFAGYAVERLGMRRLDPDEVTRYYQLTGDDFTGRSTDHGSGEERSAAFLDGWRRAEMGLPESSARPPGGIGQ